MEIQGYLPIDLIPLTFNRKYGILILSVRGLAFSPATLCRGASPTFVKKGLTDITGESQRKHMMNQDKFEELLLDRLDKIDERMTAIENRIGNLEQTTSWIKGKLEGRSEVNHIVLTSISIIVAIGAVIVAWLK